MKRRRFIGEPRSLPISILSHPRLRLQLDCLTAYPGPGHSFEAGRNVAHGLMMHVVHTQVCGTEDFSQPRSLADGQRLCQRAAVAGLAVIVEMLDEGAAHHHVEHLLAATDAEDWHPG